MKNTGVNLLTNPVNSSEERALKFTLSSVTDDDSMHIVVTDDDSMHVVVTDDDSVHIVVTDDDDSVHIVVADDDIVHIVMMKVYSPPA